MPLDYLKKKIHSLIISLKRKFWFHYLSIIWSFANPFCHWATIAKSEADIFCSQLLRENNNIPDLVLQDLHARIKEIQTQLKPLIILDVVVFFVLALSIFGIELDLDVQGIRVKETAKLIEILFLFSTTFSLVMALPRFSKNVLYECLKLSLDKTSSPRYAGYKFLSPYDLGLKFIISGIDLFSGFATKLQMLFILIVGLVYTLAFLLLMLGVYLYVGIQIYQHPAFSKEISHIIVYYGLTTSCVSGVFQMISEVIPFQRLNREFARKLEEANGDPTKEKNFYRMLGRRKWRAYSLFLRISFNKRKLLEGLSNLEKLAILGNQKAREALKEKKNKKDAP